MTNKRLFTLRRVHPPLSSFLVPSIFVIWKPFIWMYVHLTRLVHMFVCNSHQTLSMPFFAVTHWIDILVFQNNNIKQCSKTTNSKQKWMLKKLGLRGKYNLALNFANLYFDCAFFPSLSWAELKSEICWFSNGKYYVLLKWVAGLERVWVRKSLLKASALTSTFACESFLYLSQCVCCTLTTSVTDVLRIKPKRHQLQPQQKANYFPHTMAVWCVCCQ